MRDHGVRVDRRINKISIIGKSKKYQLDTIRKHTIYNLNDLSSILLEAFKRNFTYLEIPSSFMILIDDPQFGYDPDTRYIGILRGIGAQLKHFKIELKLIEPTNKYKEILKIIDK